MSSIERLICSSLLVAAAAAGEPSPGTSPRGATATRLADGSIAMANETIKLVVDPARGGSVISLIHQRVGKDIIPPKRGNDQMGLLLDHYWKDGWPWPGEMMAAAYEVVKIESESDRAAVTMRYTLKGQWAGKSDPQLAGLIFEKTIRLLAGVDAVFCRAGFRNKTKEAKIVAYWIQNYFHTGGDYDAEKDVFARPTTTGVFRRGRTVGHDFIWDAPRAWTAATDTEKDLGLAWLMDYDYLNSFYNFSNNVTQEWVYDRVLVPPGKAWSTEVAMLPFAGVRSVSHASANLIAGLHVARDDGAIVLSHTLRHATNPVEDVRLVVEVLGGSSDRKAKSTLTIGTIDGRVKAIEQKIVENIPDPLIVRVTASGQSAGKRFEEKYWDFHVGTYGYGGNVQVDMITPVYQEKRPAKRPVLLKPDGIERIRGRRWYYAMMGLFSERYRLDQAFDLAGREPPPEDVPAVGEYTLNTYGMGPQISAFPYDYDKLMRYEAVVIANVHVDCLGPIGREMLRDYVTHGGGLLVLGGMAAYACADWTGSALGDVLPVEPRAEPFDVRRIESGGLRLGRPHAIMEGIDLAARPGAEYIHQLRAVRDGAEVLLYAGKHPFLVVWEKDRGRVACVLGTPYGSTPAGGPPQYVDWEHWPRLVANVLRWLGRGGPKAPVREASLNNDDRRG